NITFFPPAPRSAQSWSWNRCTSATKLVSQTLPGYRVPSPPKYPSRPSKRSRKSNGQLKRNSLLWMSFIIRGAAVTPSSRTRSRLAPGSAGDFRDARRVEPALVRALPPLRRQTVLLSDPLTFAQLYAWIGFLPVRHL